MLHDLVATTEDTVALFKYQLANLNEADTNFYKDYLKRKFQEEGIASMTEHHFKEDWMSTILIKEPSFPLDEPLSYDEINRKNDLFIEEKEKQLKEIESSLFFESKTPIEDITAHNTKENTIESNNGIYSYEWKHKSGDDGIKMLHALLKKTKPEIISHKTNLSTFRKAFKNIQLIEKNKLSIIWCVKGPNNKITKQSLFYFLHQLDLAGFIVFKHPNTIPYIFVDKEGNPIKNIDVSQSTGSKNPTRKADIDELITKLKNKLNPNT